MSPQPLPGFGVVVDVLVLDELVLVVVEVDVLVDVVVEVVDMVEVEVVVGVVVLVVEVDVEQYWSCAGLVQYWYW